MKTGVGEQRRGAKRHKRRGSFGEGGAVETFDLLQGRESGAAPPSGKRKQEACQIFAPGRRRKGRRKSDMLRRLQGLDADPGPRPRGAQRRCDRALNLVGLLKVGAGAFSAGDRLDEMSHLDRLQIVEA